MMKNFLARLSLLLAINTWSALVRAEIPAAPVMTLYKFNGGADLPYHTVKQVMRGKLAEAAGTLAQGTSLIPCVVLHKGKALTSAGGTPYVGFDVVLDPTDATPESLDRLAVIRTQRDSLKVANHHCAPGTKHVVDARRLLSRDTAPFLEPEAHTSTTAASQPATALGKAVKSFHNSPHCAKAASKVVGRRAALLGAWEKFIEGAQPAMDKDTLERAKHLDAVVRTAIFEGHLGRGCSAYGACERNVIALSIRNRALERCASGQGCKFKGDFQGVATKVSQYNIWDEYLTQISRIASCFLRDDLTDVPKAARLRRMYEQSVVDIERILFGKDRGYEQVFTGTSAGDLKNLRHYFHPPAMGKCFPNHANAEYISGAVARHGDDHILVANRWVFVGERQESGYLFETVSVSVDSGDDVLAAQDTFPKFVLDPRKVSLRKATRCTPYGVASSCKFDKQGRYRKSPFWLDSGKSLALSCEIADRSQSCEEPPHSVTVRVGGTCDPEMQPVTRVP